MKCAFTAAEVTKPVLYGGNAVPVRTPNRQGCLVVVLVQLLVVFVFLVAMGGFGLCASASDVVFPRVF